MKPGVRITLLPGRGGACMALVVALSALVALVAACANPASGAARATPTAPSVTSPTTTAQALAPPCQGTQLTMGVTSGGAAATHILTVLTLRNASQQVCSLDGYPSLLLLDAHGHALPTHVTDATSAYLWSNLLPSTVALAPGGRAHVNLQWSDVDYTTGAICSDTPTSYSLQFTPPGSALSVAVEAQLAPCGGDLITSPVVAGS